MKNGRGVALILAVGIIALLAIIATSFALNMRLEYKAADNYYKSVKVKYAAEAAIQRAIAELKKDARQGAFHYEDESWYVGYNNTIPITESNLEFKSVIEDEQQRININTANLQLLRNICEIVGSPLSASDGDDIVAARATGYGYIRKEEVIQRAFMAVGGDTAETAETKYDKLSVWITIHSYIDNKVVNGPRSPININTAHFPVLAAVLRNVIAPDSDADAVATQIRHKVGRNPPGSNDPITSWSEFDTFIDGLVDLVPPPIDAAQATLIKNNCNPNRITNKITTEFCFHSGGYYTIAGIGEIKDGATTLAKKKLAAIVKIYDIYTDTNEGDFKDPDDAGGAYERVTWLDNCPVNSGELFGSYSLPANPETVPGSVKLGFWDDFRDSDYSVGADGEWGFNPPGVYDLTDVDMDGDEELVTRGRYTSCEIYGSEWIWGNFSLRLFGIDIDLPTSDEMRDVGNVTFWNGGAGANPKVTVLHSRQDPLEWGVYDGKGAGELHLRWTYDTGYGVISFMSYDEYMNTGYGITLQQARQDRHDYSPGQVRIFTEGVDPDENNDTPDYRDFLNHTSNKTFNVTVDSHDVTVDIWNSLGATGHLERDVTGTNYSGSFILYGHDLHNAWDDIRIIPENGNYTSKTITPDGGSNVTWGTIAGTLSHHSTTPITEYGEVYIQTSETGIDDDGDDGDDGIPDAGDGKYKSITNDEFLVIDTTSPSIQYKVWLTNGDPDMKETPILEDVTITYLVDTEIKAFYGSYDE